MKKNLFLILLTIPLTAYSEVSDKMISIPELWVQAIVVAAILLMLVRWSVWFSALAILIIAFFSVVTYETFSDPLMGPAIMEEQGMPYAISSYGSILLMFLGFLAGIVLNRKRQRAAN